MIHLGGELVGGIDLSEEMFWLPEARKLFL